MYHLYNQQQEGSNIHRYTPTQDYQQVHNIRVQLADDAQDHELSDHITPENLASILFDVDAHYKKQPTLNAYCPTDDRKKSFPLVTLANLSDRFDETAFAYHTLRQTMAFQRYGAPMITEQSAI